MPEFPLPLKQGYCRDTTYVKVLSRESCPASNVTMRGGPGCQQQLSPGMNMQRIPAGFYLTKRTSQFPASRDPRDFLPKPLYRRVRARAWCQSPRSTNQQTGRVEVA